MINNSKNESDKSATEPEKDNLEEKTKDMTDRYDNYAKANGFRLNPDTKTVERVIKGLFANEAKYGKKY